MNLDTWSSLVPSSTNLFVGDVPSQCSEKDLYSLFSLYGRVLDVRLMRKSNNQEVHLSYGFVKFAELEAAKTALRCLDGLLYFGRNLRVGWARFKPKTEMNILSHHDRMNSSSIHVTFIASELESTTVVNEEFLRMLFQPYGQIVDVSIKKSEKNKFGFACGYGFVHFHAGPTGVASAVTAIRCTNNMHISGFFFRSDISHDLERKIVTRTA